MNSLLAQLWKLSFFEESYWFVSSTETLEITIITRKYLVEID